MGAEAEAEPIRFDCPHCEKSLVVDYDWVTLRDVRACIHCEKRLTILVAVVGDGFKIKAAADDFEGI